MQASLDRTAHPRCSSAGVYGPRDPAFLDETTTDVGFALPAEFTPTVHTEGESELVGEENTERAPERGLGGVLGDVRNQTVAQRAFRGASSRAGLPGVITAYRS